MRYFRRATVTLLALIVTAAVFAQTLVLDPSDPDFAPCRGYWGPGGPCNPGPRGGLNPGPGGGLNPGPGGGLNPGPGGGLNPGPGGGMNPGPGGGLNPGPGGGMNAGPGGGIYPGPPSEFGYHGPWGPCITGALGRKWIREHCPAT
jgi:hypothetical protein